MPTFSKPGNFTDRENNAPTDVPPAATREDRWKSDIADKSTVSAARAPAPPANPVPEESVINKGLKITGNLESDGAIVVSGVVLGDINSRTLTVSQGADVKGTLTAETVRILGRVEGEIRTSLFHVASTGEMSGDVRYERMAIEEGATIDGRLSKGKRDEAETAKPETAKPDAANPAPEKAESAKPAADKPATDKGAASAKASGPASPGIARTFGGRAFS